MLAERYQQEPSRSFDDEAAAVAAGLRGIRWDWSGRPCLTWSAAAELLESMQAETRRILAERAERMARSDGPRAVPTVTRTLQPNVGTWE